ncbi:MAG: class F sortase [Acidimicrobiales bacterium]
MPGPRRGGSDPTALADRRAAGRSRLGPILSLVAGVALVAAALIIGLRTGPPEARAATAPVNLGVVPGLDVGQGAPAGPAGGDALPVADGAAPERVRIPSLGVDAPIAAVSVDTAGTLGLPVDPPVLGWWGEGARPGAERGTTILAGHVNSATLGPGALAHLTELRPGDQVVIVGADRELRFRVEAVRQYPKRDLPAAEAFSQDVAGRLAIVSCGGPLNPRSGHYVDNVIAYAVTA